MDRVCLAGEQLVKAISLCSALALTLLVAGCAGDPTPSPTPTPNAAGRYACSYYEGVTQVRDVLSQEAHTLVHQKLSMYASDIGALYAPASLMESAVAAGDDRQYEAAARAFQRVCVSNGWWPG